jgi:GxxExxY protein
VEQEPLKLKLAKLTGAILNVFYDVYNELGTGFLESVYLNAMALALGSAGHRVDCKVPVSVWFRGSQVGNFETDLIVDGGVMLELKAARAIDEPPPARQSAAHLLKSRFSPSLGVIRRRSRSCSSLLTSGFKRKSTKSGRWSEASRANRE